MILSVVFRPEAEADLLQARHWYDEQQPGLGDAFADSVDEVIARIEAMPQMYPVVFRDVRRGKARRFPYLVYYRVLSRWIEIIGVLHGRRDPKLWQERVS